MFSTIEWVYVAKDGKKFLSKEECAKYEQEKFLMHRYVVTLQASFIAVYEAEGHTEEEAIDDARAQFKYEYDQSNNYNVVAIDVQCDDDEEED